MTRFQLWSRANGGWLGCRGQGRIVGGGFGGFRRKVCGDRCNLRTSWIVDEGVLGICGCWRCLTLRQHDPGRQTDGGDGEQRRRRCHECEPRGGETRRRVSACIEYHIDPLL